MTALMFRAVATPPLHNGQFTADEFICMGLMALVLVVGTFITRSGGGKKDEATAKPGQGPAQQK